MLGTFLIWFWIFGSLILIGYLLDYRERHALDKAEDRAYRHRHDADKQPTREQ